MSIRYRALYGGQSCTASPEGEGNGRTFTVQLDKDPGVGSMVYTRVGRSQLVLGDELPLLQPFEEKVSVEVSPELQWRSACELGTQSARVQGAAS
jgi:hypothetical protein